MILLRDLLKKTAATHVDYENIKTAHEYLDNICKAVNENKRYADNLKKQMEDLAFLQNKIRYIQTYQVLGPLNVTNLPTDQRRL